MKDTLLPLREYGEIFDVRGREYHEAMLRFPQAREEEFLNVLALAEIKTGQVVCDYPAGGGYLAQYIDVPVELVLLETSQAFMQCAREGTQARRCLLVKDGKIPLHQNEADRFISLAGVHHISDKLALFDEVYRCLDLGGLFVLADARAGSGVAGFLNEFVHAHSDTGHEGMFLSGATADELEESGFNILFNQPIAYPWKFASIADMVECCRLMFGITKASPQEIEDAIRRYLGITQYGAEFHMGWELLFFVAEK